MGFWNYFKPTTSSKSYHNAAMENYNKTKDDLSDLSTSLSDGSSAAFDVGARAAGGVVAFNAAVGYVTTTFASAQIATWFTGPTLGYLAIKAAYGALTFNPALSLIAFVGVAVATNPDSTIKLVKNTGSSLINASKALYHSSVSLADSIASKYVDIYEKITGEEIIDEKAPLAIENEKTSEILEELETQGAIDLKNLIDLDSNIALDDNEGLQYLLGAEDSISSAA